MEYNFFLIPCFYQFPFKIISLEIIRSYVLVLYLKLVASVVQV